MVHIKKKNLKKKKGYLTLKYAVNFQPRTLSTNY